MSDGEPPQNRLMLRAAVAGAIVLIVGGVVAWRSVQTNGPTDQGAEQDDSWEQRIAAGLKTADCPAPTPITLDATSYQGPLFDAHFHPPSLPDSELGSADHLREKRQTLLGVNTTVSEIVCLLRNDGTSGQALAFFPVYPTIADPALDVVQRTMERYPDVFVPFIMPPDDDGSPTGSPTVDAATLDAMLARYPGLFRGYGEIGLYARQGGSAALAPNDPRLLAIYPVLRKHNLVVYFHLGEGHAEAFEQVLRDNRDLTFIWHGDQLIPYGRNGAQNLSLVEGILERNPNAYYGVDELYGDEYLLRPEVSKEQFLTHFKSPEPLLAKDVATWKGFIERHPDQVFWDTDRGTFTWSLDLTVGRTLSNYARAFIAKLDPAVQEKYAYRNAERILSE